MVAMLLLSSTTYAVEMNNSHMPTQMTTMSKAEAIQMLKDAGVELSKIKMLENGEMAKTEAKYGWWGALAGGASGAYGYLGYAAGSHSFSWTGLGGAVTAGTVRGVLTPTATAVAWTIGSHAGMVAGYTAGSLWK